MKRMILSLTFLGLLARPAAAQSPEIKFIADTLVVQAEGTFEVDPDLATLTFDVSSREKNLKQAYDAATQSMRRIVALAERNKLKKEDVSSGVLTVAPLYGVERKIRARAYFVRGQIVLKVRDFSLLGPLLDGSVEEGIVDLRSLTYTLVDEEAAKQRAIALAMQRAMGRANAALEQKGQKAGPLRYASVDVTQLMGVAGLESVPMAAQAVRVSAETRNIRREMASPSAVLPPVAPEKITVRATVQCAFQIL